MDAPRKKNFLKEVVVRLDFAVPVNKIRTKLPPNLNKAIMQEFPILEPRNVVSGMLNIDKDIKNTKFEKEEFKQWIYFGKNREKRLELNHESIVLAVKDYSYEELRTTFIGIVKSLLDTYDDLQFKRFGLRYINEINLKETGPTHWEQYLDENLLKIFEVYPNRDEISRAFQVLCLNKGDFNITFQYGIHNPDYPATIRRKQFILDYDAYKAGLIEDLSEIEGLLTSFRKGIKELFNHNVKPELKNKIQEPL